MGLGIEGRAEGRMLGVGGGFWLRWSCGCDNNPAKRWRRTRRFSLFVSAAALSHLAPSWQHKLCNFTCLDTHTYTHCVSLQVLQTHTDAHVGLQKWRRPPFHVRRGCRRRLRCNIVAAKRPIYVSSLPRGN